MSDSPHIAIPVLPYTLCFPTGKIRASEVPEDRDEKNGSFRFATAAGKTGMLYLGDTFLSKVRVNEDASGFTAAGPVSLSDNDALKARLSQASLRLSVLAGNGWIGCRGPLVFRKDDLIELDQDPGAPALLVYRDSGAVIGNGEVMDVGGFWGLRIQELYDVPRMPPGLKGFVQTQVFLGSMDMTVADIRTMGEGTILQLDTPLGDSLTLFSGDTPLAEGYLQTYSDRKPAFTQTFTRSMTADSPKLFFRVTGAGDGAVRAGNAGTGMPREFRGMMKVLKFLPSDRLLGFLKSIPADLSAFVLKCTASQAPAKAALLLHRLMETAEPGFLSGFILCNPVSASVHVDAEVAGALFDICDASEKEAVDSTEPAAFDDPYDPMNEAACTVLELNLGQRMDVLKVLEGEAPELCEEFRKNFLFIEDLVLLEDRAVQTLLREVDVNVLVRVLLRSGGDVREKIFANMSSRAGNMLREEMDLAREVSDDLYFDAAGTLLGILGRLINGGDVVI